MSGSPVTYRVEDGVGIITLNRPDKLNAWTGEMDELVYRFMGEASADDAVRVVLFTGAGRGFCAGADMESLKQIQSRGSQGNAGMGSEQIDRRIEADVPADFGLRYTYFPSVPKPIIGAINGVAAGIGMVLALYCDVRLWSDAARMNTVFAKRGLIAEHGIGWMLQRLVGPSRTAELLFSARFLHADEALNMGLANAVFPAASFEEDALAYAKNWATTVSPRSLRVMKRQLWNDAFSTLTEAVERGNSEMVSSFDTEDFKEGLAHFLEKRAPRFTGR
ncbi:MAG: enoyl-CoA hydratase/isomerase family protein [Gammaproteobacteria bacterium]|nr:enoyl-CoA hydratase/isomerase family protein [Gammaproteobacteria bacterium]